MVTDPTDFKLCRTFNFVLHILFLVFLMLKHWMDHPFPAAIGSQELGLLVCAAHHLADVESFFPASGSTRYTLSTARENVSPVLVSSAFMSYMEGMVSVIEAVL
ncbi:hypothetical protein HYQ44_013441 [Verticillium longisporum]|nr:hypothetical protein HYQ44_013441 [Verticillium longisporum]